MFSGVGEHQLSLRISRSLMSMVKITRDKNLVLVILQWSHTGEVLRLSCSANYQYYNN